MTTSDMRIKSVTIRGEKIEETKVNYLDNTELIRGNKGIVDDPVLSVDMADNIEIS